MPGDSSVKQPQSSPEKIRFVWRKWVITGGGLGLLKPAPGSWGTLGPALLFWILLWAKLADPWRSMVCLMGAIITGMLTVQLSPWAIRYFGRADPGPVVLDEYCGYWIACLFLPLPVLATSSLWHAWITTAGVYILFRLLDTLKIPPCRQLEHLPAGWGILFDDIAAGIQVNILLQVALRLIHF
ncbi:MAG: phosphatidylglycerophosphatase A family protein [Phycisphaerae bacterium]